MVVVPAIGLVAWLSTAGAAAAPEAQTREGYVMPTACRSREAKGDRRPTRRNARSSSNAW